MGVESWAGASGGGHCLKVVGVVRARSARGSDRETDTWGPHVFFIIPKLSKLAQHKKNQNGYLNLLQKFQIFACG
jgi:hypothetical protein